MLLSMPTFAELARHGTPCLLSALYWQFSTRKGNPVPVLGLLISDRLAEARATGRIPAEIPEPASTSLNQNVDDILNSDPMLGAINVLMGTRNGRMQPWPVFTFRVGTAADFLRCAELWMHAVALRDGIGWDPHVQHRALTKLSIPGGVLSVAESGAQVCGFALAIDRTPPGAARTAHLTLLAVDPAVQSLSLGQSLLANITQLLVIAGFANATLGVLKENPAARQMYEKAGWQVTGHGTFQDSGRPSIRYRLQLKNDIQ
jgi:ribosomal protein S18 acetylase RimI-like enzyme